MLDAAPCRVTIRRLSREFELVRAQTAAPRAAHRGAGRRWTQGIRRVSAVDAALAMSLQQQPEQLRELDDASLLGSLSVTSPSCSRGSPRWRRAALTATGPVTGSPHTASVSCPFRKTRHCEQKLQLGNAAGNGSPVCTVPSTGGRPPGAGGCPRTRDSLVGLFRIWSKAFLAKNLGNRRHFRREVGVA